MSFKDAENSDNSLLHYGVKSDNLELIKYLKGVKEANLDTRNANGETALHLCCGQTANVELAKYLILSGASTQIKNALGDTPVTLATRFGHAELALLLNTSDQSMMSACTSPNYMSCGKPPMPMKQPPVSDTLMRSPERDVIIRKKKPANVLPRRADSSYASGGPGNSSHQPMVLPSGATSQLLDEPSSGAEETPSSR